LHGACGVPIGMNHVLFVGGVNYDLFYEEWVKSRERELAKERGDTVAINHLNALRKAYMSNQPDWYKFNKQVLVYHTITNSWAVADEYPFPPPAGAKMVSWKNGWLVINGETMPGVRSAKVYYGEIKADPKFGWLNWFLLLSYLGGMLYLGFFFMKREKSTEDFFKGGGRIPWWAAGMSIFATMLSAITFMAIPAKAYATDWRYFPLGFTILILAFPVIRYYLPFYRRLKVTTAYEYLEKRFNYPVRFIASLLFIVFMIARMAMVLYLPSLALAAVTGIDIFICIGLMGVITVIYCTMGGIEAVVWGDVIQGFVLLGGAFLAALFLISGTEGGFAGVIDISSQYHKMKIFDFSFDFTEATIWVILIGGLANNLISYSSDQAVIQRYMTTKDEKSAGKGILLNGIMSVLVLVLFYFIGTALFAFYKTNPGEMNFAMEKTDSIFPHFIMSKMPVGIAGILIAAIFSATMSTVSSSVNSISTSFTVDIYVRLSPKIDDKRQLQVARWSGIIFGSAGIVFALLLATWDILSLFDYFNFVLGLLTSGLGGLFVMGIFFPRIDGRSALVGFTFGTLFLFFVNMNTNVSFWLYGAIGLVSTVAIALFFSFIFSNKKEIKGLTWKTIKK
jgi:SSS family solute:Na+ symporter